MYINKGIERITKEEIKLKGKIYLVKCESLGMNDSIPVILALCTNACPGLHDQKEWGKISSGRERGKQM